jgi:hypothetical protein
MPPSSRSNPFVQVTNFDPAHQSTPSRERTQRHLESPVVGDHRRVASFNTRYLDQDLGSPRANRHNPCRSGP